MDANLDNWITKLRNKTPLEENELELLCRIVKDVFMQEPNVIVCSFDFKIKNSQFPLLVPFAVIFTANSMI